ncbi:MAG: outer membrane protein assembly factor BamA [Spirochaetales bacterium]|nr:outer membrane protein assembly factor BamA [Spirochaetales bacterium]
MRKFRLFIIVFCFSLSFNMYAQDLPWYIDKEIVEIKFEGLVNFDEAQVASVVSPYIGKKFNDKLYMDIYYAVSDLGLFSDIKVRADSVDNKEEQLILVFMVVENPFIKKIEIVGNKSIPDTEIFNELASKEGEIYKNTLLRVDESTIKMLYREKGFTDVKINARVEKMKDNNVYIFFEIEEGLRKIVREVLFIGNHNIKQKELKKFLSTEIATLIKKGYYSEANTDLDIAAVEAFYKSKGFYDSKVMNSDVEFNTDVSRGEISVTVKYYIYEGAVYHFGDYSFDGNKVFSNEEINKAVRLKNGDVFNYSQYKADIRNVTNLYSDEGYIFNTITQDEIVDRENKTVSVHFSIVERMRAHIEEIRIEGNKKTKLHVIMRELPFQVGDVFSQSKVYQGWRNLYSLGGGSPSSPGYFESVELLFDMGSAPGLMILTIKVKESQAVDLQFGITFSQENPEDDFPIKFVFSWTDKNFLGEGMSFGANTEISSSVQSAGLNYSVNYLNDERIYLGANFFYRHSSRSRVLQDLVGPNDTGVPDPYEGYYVYSEDLKDADGNIIHRAGDRFDGVPTSEQISDNSLVTDYSFARLSGEVIADEFLMRYESHSLNLGFGAGYSWFTPVGIFSLKGNLGFSLTHISYDEDLYRPYERFLRDYNNKFFFKDNLGLKFVWDFRNRATNNGFYLSNTTNFYGGLLLGSNHYIKNNFMFEGYAKLFDVKVNEKWSYKTILAVHSSLDLFLPNFVFEKGEDGKIGTRTSSLSSGDYQNLDLLYTDGMITKKGWAPEMGLAAVWQNWIELRWPLYENYLNAELFFEATGTWDDLAKMGNVANMYQHFYFTIGAGFRVTYPSLPIGLFLVKRFKVDGDGAVQWQTGSLNASGKDKMGLDFVISFTYSF